jgi:hypothetical protein
MLIAGTVGPLSQDVVVQDMANVPMLQNPGSSGTDPESYPWYSYFHALSQNPEWADAWTVFDDSNWQPSWYPWPSSDSDPATPYIGSSWGDAGGLNFIPNLMDAQVSPTPGAGGTNYQAPPQANLAQWPFGAAAASAEGLPPISFIVPPYFFSEHPAWLPVDGECYIATVVDALVNGADWDNDGVVLIVTYDENDGHFDHVVPPTSMQDQQLIGTAPSLPISLTTPMVQQPAQAPTTGSWEPWVKLPAGNNLPEIIGPLGAGFRVPTMIVSPWTFGGMISSQVAADSVFDHTSVIQYLEEITEVPCENLPSDPTLNWRRETFSSISALVDTTGARASKADVAAALADFPLSQVYSWRSDLLTRLYTANPSGSKIALPTPSPDPLQAWPPLQQTCYLVADKTTFGLDEVAAQAQATGAATFPSAFWVMVDGFDQAELNLGPYAPAGSQPVLPVVSLTGPGQQVPPTGIQWSVGSAEPIAGMPPEIPQRFRFPVDVTFTTDDEGNYPAFAGVTLTQPEFITVAASFASHLSWQAVPFEIELVVAPDPYFIGGPIGYLST